MLTVLADAPVHALPWYFGAALFAVWAAALVGLGVLFRRRMRARAERRAESRRPGRTQKPSGPIRDDRSLGSGGDLEPF